MAIRDLIPWRRDTDRSIIPGGYRDPFQVMQENMNRMIEEFWRDPWGMRPFQSIWERESDFMPMVNISESEKEIKVSAEIPGMDEKDISLSLDQGRLVLSGKKEAEKEEKDARYHRIERHYGSFYREIPLPEEVVEDKVEAIFKNGVLTVTLPKVKPSSPEQKRIPIKTG